MVFHHPKVITTLQKNKQKGPTCLVFSPLHTLAPSFIQPFGPGRCFSAAPGGYCEDYRKSICGWTKSIGSEGIHVQLGPESWFFQDFCSFATPKFEKFSDVCWFPL